MILSYKKAIAKLGISASAFRIIICRSEFDKFRIVAKVLSYQHFKGNRCRVYKYTNCVSFTKEFETKFRNFAEKRKYKRSEKWKQLLTT